MRETEEIILRKRFAEVARQRGVLGRIFGIGQNLNGMRGSKLIEPSSPFSLFMLFVSFLLQLYSSLTSAFLVSFLYDVDICEIPPPTLYFDMIVDAFFLFEVFVKFFTGRYIAGEYEDDLSRVVQDYFLHGLLFDLVTSFPVSYLELSWLHTRCLQNAEGMPQLCVFCLPCIIS